MSDTEQADRAQIWTCQRLMVGLQFSTRGSKERVNYA